MFLGVPYAAPPVGPLRWKPPQPSVKWAGVKETMQLRVSVHADPTVSDDMHFRDPGQSEDCLNLNVWTPAKDKQGEASGDGVDLRRRVYVPGATSEPRQDGQHLAHKGVVVVSMNYRLGVFGFFVLAGSRGGIAAACRGELRPDGSDRGARMGEAEYRCVRRRPGQCDAVWRISRLFLGERTDGVAVGAGSVRACDWRKRRAFPGQRPRVSGHWLMQEKEECRLGFDGVRD